MEENGIITGMIPNSGSANGIHRTYEDSFFAFIHGNYFENTIRHEFEGLYFDKSNFSLISLHEFSDTAERIKRNPENYIKVVILNFYRLESNYYFIEYISQSSLHEHLVHEEEMRQNGYGRTLRIE